MIFLKKLNFASKLLLLFFACMVFWWIDINYSGKQNATTNYLFGIFEGLIPLFVGIFSVGKAKQWGVKSAVGRSVLFFAISLIGWGSGILIEGYYNIFLEIPVPYPSLGDIGYVLSIIFVVLGTLTLARATGATARVKTVWGKLFSLLVLLIMLIFSYYVFFIIPVGAWPNFQGESVVKVCLDLFYNASDAVILFTSFLMFGLSAKSLGGRFKTPIRIILLALLMIYLSDMLYNFQINAGTYFVANIADLQYTFAFCLLSFAVLLFDPKFLFQDGSQMLTKQE